MKAFRRLFFMVMMMGVAQTSHAHRFFTAFSQVNIRPETKTVEVVHRLFTHDVEDILRMKLGNSASLTDQQIEPVLKAYVEKSFGLFDAAGKRLPLSWVGMEYKVDDIHVYQEAPLEGDGRSLSIINHLFMDNFPEQTNTVNFEREEVIRTLIFTKDKAQQKITFE